MPHLILVGLPGAGKSSVGAALARHLDRGFLDFDAEITRREGMSISELFARRGEPHFRALEHSLTEELRQVGGMILAPGGGWVSRPDTVALVRPPARLLYLRIRPQAALLRMGRSAAARPLLGRANPAAELERLLGARRTAYESADFVVDVEGVGIQEVVKRILSTAAL